MAPFSKSWCSFGFACKWLRLRYLAPCVMAWRIASATMPGSRARVAVIAPSDTTPFEPSLQLVPKRPAFTPRSRSQPRPEDGGASEDGARATNGRRPADVWVGNCGLLGPAAFDLAVTSGLRSGHLPSTVADGRRAVSDYEVKKFPINIPWPPAHQRACSSCPWLRKLAAGDGAPRR